MKRHRRIISLFLMIFIFLSFTACEKPMSEEEIKEACMAEAENFVGGYLSNTNLDYLDKYIVYSDDFKRHKLEADYDWYGGTLIIEKVADYILKNATFETDRFSFTYNKETERAKLNVNVTILPSKKVFDKIEEYVKQNQYSDDMEAAAIQAIFMIGDIQPVTVHVPIEFIYNDQHEDWEILQYWLVMKAINEAE